ncbi:sugar diacid recognition domain-containing protein [Oscillospiraceae bacterium PP1C4]
MSKRNAEQIVKEISVVISESINMMNAQGIIIASTDSSRIGTFHEAAKKLIDEGLDELIIQGDHDYIGAKAGINLPVILNDEIIGVVGVTGPYQQVVKYGQIIKKMTEILLLDHSYREQKELNDNIRSRFIEEWICTDIKNVNNAMEKRGLSLGIDITVARRIMVMSALVNDESDITAAQKSFDGASKIISQIMSEDKNNVMLKSTATIICAVNANNDGTMLQLANRIKKEVEQKVNVTLAIGIDTQVSYYTLIYSAYLKAAKALQACLRTYEKEICFYDDINMEIFSSEIPEMVKEEYIRKIFKGYTPKEIAQWIIMLDTLYKEDGSITVTAQKLFIHKNTLQYKLKKLKEQTGYDPRSIHYSPLYYNAIYFYREIQRNLHTFIEKY